MLSVGPIQRQIKKAYVARKDSGDKTTQAELAELLGFKKPQTKNAQAMVSKLINGTQSMTEEQILAFCNEFGLEIVANKTSVYRPDDPAQLKEIFIRLRNLHSKFGSEVKVEKEAVSMLLDLLASEDRLVVFRILEVWHQSLQIGGGLERKMATRKVTALVGT